MRPIFFWFLFAFALGLKAHPEEDRIAKRIQAHLLIGDYPSASEEALMAFSQNPESQVLFESTLKALAKQGDEKELWELWNRHISKFPSLKTKRDLLENIAWGIISHASHSPSPVIRIMALLGAFFGQDAKGTEILCVNMQDQNSMIRAAAVELAGHLRDSKLCDEVVKVFHKEKNWQVRLTAIKALGKMKIEAAKEDLIRLISDDHAMAEEKAAAIEAIVNMMEDADREEIEKLAKSNRAGLRILACEVVSTLDLERDTDLVVQLLSDYHSEVRQSAIKTLGILKVKKFQEIPLSRYLLKFLDDSDPVTAITAAWLLTIQNCAEGSQAFERWLKDQDRDLRLLASAALAETGKYGLEKTVKIFAETDDPLVKMNLAFGLIGNRVDCDKACEALYKGLTLDEPLDWVEEGGFRRLAPSRGGDEATHQLTHLEILNILAIMKYPRSQEAVRAFLKEKNWGITGMASALLLTEGDDTAVDLVESLLHDPDPKIKLQAAQVLAMWGKGENAVTVLQNAYEGADREQKEHILEALGKVGMTSTIPFLVQKMQEPFQTLRILAAAALLECLYN